MGLEKEKKLIQSKNAHASAQYVTIPASIVQDSQYPFGDGGKVRVYVEPDPGVMRARKRKEFGARASKTQYGLLLLKKDFRDLPAGFKVIHQRAQRDIKYLT